MKRRSQHLRMLRSGAHTNPKLQHAWSKYGEASFAFEIIEYVDGGAPALLEREQHYIDSLRPRLNCRLRATSPTESLAFTQGTWRDRIAAQQRGVSRPPEVIAKMSAAMKARVAAGFKPPRTDGRKHTPEECAKMRANSKGKNTGHVLSSASRDKIATKAVARLAALSSDRRGKLLARLSAQQALAAERAQRPEARAKRSAAMKTAWVRAKAAGTLTGGRPIPPPYTRSPKKSCVICGGDNPARPGRRATCSTDCGLELARRTRRQSESAPDTRVCAECREPFLTTCGRRAEACSRRCAALRWRRSQRAA